MRLFDFLERYIVAISTVLALVLIFVFSKFLNNSTYAVGLVGMVVAVAFLFTVFVKKPENALFVMAFFLPFERIPSVDLGGMSLKINHIVALTAFLALLVNSIAGQRKIKSDPILVMVLILLADIALSITYAANISRAVQVFAFMALMALVYFTAKSLINSRRDVEMVLKGIIYGAIAVALLGAFQFLGDSIGLPNSVTLLKKGYDSGTFGFARVQGASQEPLYFANYIFIPFLILIFLLIDGKLKEILPRWLGILLIVLLGVNFILAISRGAFLAAGAIGLILIATKYKKLLTLKVIIPAISVLVVVVIGVYLGLLRSEPRALDEFVGHLLVNDRVVGESVSSRLDAIDQAKELFLSNQMLGVGIGNYGPSVQHEFDADGKPVGGWFIVNNEYLELLAELGLFGLLAFVALIITVTYYAIKAIRSCPGNFVSSSLEGSLFALYAILFQYMTFSTLYIFHLWFLIAFISGQSAYLLNRRNKAYEN